MIVTSDNYVIYFFPIFIHLKTIEMAKDVMESFAVM